METIVKITNSGIFNVVPLGAYETVYKDKGWTVVENRVENELDSELKAKGIIDEDRQNAYIQTKNERANRHFNDGLFIGE